MNKLAILPPLIAAGLLRYAYPTLWRDSFGSTLIYRVKWTYRTINDITHNKFGPVS
jgi:hypothetical protein